MKHQWLHSASRVLSGVLFLVGAQFVIAEEPQLAPVNPEWLSYQEQRQLRKIPMRADDGHALGYIPSPLDLSHLKDQQICQPGKRLSFEPSYDLRDHNKVTPVKNQNPYGTCWAFATYGSMESCLLPSETNDFSENNLVNLDGFDAGFDDGGNYDMSTAYLARWGGPVTESDDPYPNPGGSSSNLTVQKHVQQVLIIPARTNSFDNDNIKQAVVTNGAVGVSMYYSSSYFNSSSNAYYYSGSASANHAVDIVGWDDNYSSNSFSTAPSGNGAFIVRNSWGTDWGDSGYFYISYYDTRIGQSANYQFNNAESTTNYLTAYQYDPLGWVTSLGYPSSSSPTSAWAANVFTVSYTGTVSAISFYMGSVSSRYEIYIYTDVSTGSPRSGTLKTSQTGSVTNAGYYTISLNSPVSLSSENNFSVAVKFTTPGYNYPIPSELQYAGYSSAATSSVGQSYVSSASATWSDLVSYYTNGNVCIKAFLSWKLGTPTGVSASDGTYMDKIAVNWNSVLGVTNYQVWRTQYPQTNSSQASLLANNATVTNYNDTSNTVGSLYYYWIRAQAPGETSEFSNADSGWRSWLPAVPTGVSATDGTYTDKISVTWTASINASTYNLYRNTSNDSASATELENTSSTNYDDTTASESITYYYWVKSVNDRDNVSNFSTPDTGWRASVPEPEPEPAPPSEPAPDAPTWISATDGAYSNKVRVSWAASSNATGYLVWRNTVNASASATLLTTTSATGCDDSTVTLNSTYYYWVKAKNAQGESGFSPGDSGYTSLIPTADLRATDFEMLPDVIRARASPEQVSVRVSNQGPNSMTGSNSWVTLSVYLSSNETFGDEDDISMGSVSTYMPMIPGQTTDVELSFADRSNLQVPSSVSTGFYTAFLRADHTLLADPEATNNIAQRVDPIEVIVSGGLVRNDFDGDGKTDLAVYHDASGYWFMLLSGSSTIYYQKLGESGYEPVPGDFDGDGKTDLTVYHEASGYWFILLSSTGSLSYQKFGESGYHPVSGDFNGDWKTDLAVYHEGSGYWFILLSGIGSTSYQKLGESGYEPVPGDFDGDGKTDLTVYHETSGYWFILLSSTGSLFYQKFGETGYLPVSGDFDGDWKTDLAVYHEGSGYWFVTLSGSGILSYQKFGESGYQPVPGDFDGDGKTDLAVYHESTGYWYVLFSSSYTISYQKFGETGYSPVW